METVPPNLVMYVSLCITAAIVLVQSTLDKANECRLAVLLQVHIMDQRELDKGAGPIGVVLAPTRELAEQIHKETRKFARAYGE